MIKTPKLLDVPTKLLPLITEFDNYRYFLIEGGRGSSKTNTIARLLLYIAELYSVRIVCGRETQKSIDESVYMILSDLIRDFELNFTVQKAKIESKGGSEIRFKGFREQGSVNIKGLEGVDILWCFPAGTKIDGKNIEDIKSGDYINSFNHETKQIEKRKVIRTMKNPMPNNLFRLTSSGKQSIICTSEHPIYIKDKGYIPICDIKEGDIVYASKIKSSRIRALFGWLWRNDANKYQRSESEILKERRSLLSRLLKEESKRENEENECFGESIKSGISQGRKREGRFKTSKNIIKRSWSWLVGRIPDTDRARSGQLELSNLLQGRHSEYLLRDMYRSRWWESQNDKEERGRCQERCFLTEQRVESIEILEQDDIARLGLCNEGNYVYNLEVERNNNYFANGLLVHNCDEAESLTKNTIDITVPTIRKENSKIIFTFNRFVRDDPVYTMFVNRPDCLHIHIDYFENEFCPEVLINEANECKARNERDYNHIWLGQPLDRADNFLFSVEKLDKCKTIEPIGDLYKRQTVMGIDLAASGGDSCVASILERVSNVHWELKTQEVWTEPNTMASVGKVIGLIGKYKPDIIVVDAGGLGLPMFQRMKELGINNLFGFNGATTDGIALNAGNARADGYLSFNEFLDNDWLIISSDQTLKEMETIQLSPHRHSNGRIYIKSKQDMKSEGIHSPDKADSVMMAIVGIKRYLGKINYSDRAVSFNYQRTNQRAQFRERRA